MTEIRDAHSPPPWTALENKYWAQHWINDKNGAPVTGPMSHEDAGLIIVAVNNHEKLISTLTAFLEWFDKERPEVGPGTLPLWVVDARSLLATLKQGE